MTQDNANYVQKLTAIVYNNSTKMKKTTQFKQCQMKISQTLSIKQAVWPFKTSLVLLETQKRITNFSHKNRFMGWQNNLTQNFKQILTYNIVALKNQFNTYLSRQDIVIFCHIYHKRFDGQENLFKKGYYKHIRKRFLVFYECFEMFLSKKGVVLGLLQYCEGFVKNKKQ